MTDVAQETIAIGATEVAQSWLDAWRTAIDTHDADALETLFVDGATFRELLVFDWDFRSLIGSGQIARALTGVAADRLPRDPRVRGGDEAAGDATQVTAFIAFSTEVGSCEGFLQLTSGDDGLWRAQACVVQLIELEGFPEAVGANRPIGKQHGPLPGRVSWAEQQDPDFLTSEPQVVIVGAGHNGLALAARLGRLGVSTLVLERNARVGDNWRNRYSSLALHDPVGVDHLPYLPLPASWPKFTPKDKFADYLESYATLLDIVVWTGSDVTDVSFDPTSQTWAVGVDRGGVTRTLTTNHFVVATGYNNLPVEPDFPGAETFQGTIVHSSRFAGGEGWEGKRTLVVGSGVSGHDVAQDIAERGGDVTMLQRSPTYVIDSATLHRQSFALFLEGGPKTEDADLMGAALPFGLYPALGPGAVAAGAEADRVLLDGLEKAGFALGWGPDGQGALGLVFRQNKASYYYNIGASELIIDGSIGIRQGAIDHFTPTGVVLVDGSEIEADLVVLATGYKSARESSRPLLGDAIVDALPAISTVGDDLEYTGVWRHSGVDRLWFMIALGIFWGRFYSRPLALQIKAIEEGLIPAGRSRPASS